MRRGRASVNPRYSCMASVLRCRHEASKDSATPHQDFGKMLAG